MTETAIDQFVISNDFEKEKCSIGDEWWHVKTLVKASAEFQVFDLDLKSVDLGVMPWTLKSVFHFIEHVMDIKACSLKHPIILSPSGWIMNGWHRVAKAILKGDKTIKAVRFKVLPPPDGIDNENK